MSKLSAYTFEELVQIRKDLIAENKALREELKIANEKQVPVKVIKGNKYKYDYKCECNASICQSSNYCCKCGRKIDWTNDKTTSTEFPSEVKESMMNTFTGRKSL